MEVYNIVQEAVIKIVPKKNAKRQNGCLRGLKNSYEKKRSKRQRRKGKIYLFECRVPKNRGRDKKAFLSDQCKEVEENNRMGKTRDLLRKVEIPTEHFMQRWAQ